MGDAGGRRARLRRDVAKKSAGRFPHRAQFVAHIGPHPQTVADRKPLVGVFDRGDEFVCPFECGFGFGRAIAPRSDQRISHRDLQLHALLYCSGRRRDLIGFRQRLQQRLRLRDLRELRRRRKSFCRAAFKRETPG